MARSAVSGTAATRKSAPVLTDSQADKVSQLVTALLLADQHIGNAITLDIDATAAYDSPFAHPLYPIRIKVESLRGKFAKQLGAYARDKRAKERTAKRAAKA